MQKTTNYDMNLPEESENFNVEHFNENFEIMDEGLNEKPNFFYRGDVTSFNNPSTNKADYPRIKKGDLLICEYAGSSGANFKLYVCGNVSTSIVVWNRVPIAYDLDKLKSDLQDGTLTPHRATNSFYANSAEMAKKDYDGNDIGTTYAKDSEVPKMYKCIVSNANDNPPSDPNDWEDIKVGDMCYTSLTGNIKQAKGFYVVKSIYVSSVNWQKMDFSEYLTTEDYADIEAMLNEKTNHYWYSLTGSNTTPSTNLADFEGVKVGDICTTELGESHTSGYKTYIATYVGTSTVMWSEIVSSTSLQNYKEYRTTTSGTTTPNITLQTGVIERKIYTNAAPTSVSVNPPSGTLSNTAFLDSYVSFRTRSTPPTFTSTIYHRGDNCADGVFTPVANKIYDIHYRWNGLKLFGEVISFDVS